MEQVILFSLLALMVQIPDPTLASLASFAYLGQNLDSCTCIDFENESGFGNCQRKMAGEKWHGNRKVCYVNLPSSCSDITDSGTNPDKKLSAEACKEEPKHYQKQSIKSACCTGPNQFHEQCNCKANAGFCKEACNHDKKCKGYVVQGKRYCQIATTSTCPKTNGCTKHQIGNVGDLDGSASCGSTYQGCFIKQSGGK